jgi:hemerythrin-like metal-binding protein
MSTLEWSDALSLELPVMDDTHREFVGLLAGVEAADDDTVLNQWSALIDHTDAHFGQEDRWMAQTGFSSGNCHSTQHQIVLQVMREGLAGQNVAMVRQMATELALWFPQHAQSMDAALALHLRSVGLDPATGLVGMPQALPENAIHGCGGVSCSG